MSVTRRDKQTSGREPGFGLDSPLSVMTATAATTNLRRTTRKRLPNRRKKSKLEFGFAEQLVTIFLKFESSEIMHIEEIFSTDSA